VSNRQHAFAGDVIVALGGLSGSTSRVGPAGHEAVYSIRANRWRALDGPWRDPLDWPGAVWTGKSLIVVGTPCDEDYGDEDTDPYCGDRAIRAWSYRPGLGEWRPLARPPRPSPGPSTQPHVVEGLGWTGRDAVFRVGVGLGSDYWTYAPDTGDWTIIGTAKGPAREPVALPGGERVCVAGGEIFRVTHAPALDRAGGTLSTARYDRDRRAWRPLPDHPAPGSGNTTFDIMSTMSCAGDAIVAFPGFQRVQRTSGILRLDPASGRWLELTPIPLAFLFAGVGRAEDTTILWPIERDRHYWLLRDGSTTWVPVEKPTTVDTGAESDGRRILVESGESGDVVTYVDLLGYAREQGALP
jgi:hypothetical protein